MTSFHDPSLREHILGGLACAGYAFIEQFEPCISTATLFPQFGQPLALGGGEAVHDIKPASQAEAHPNSYSEEYGLGCFPLHTDLAHWHFPPRYLLLRCAVGFDDVATRIVDVEQYLDEAVVATFARALVQPRRRVRGRRPLLRLYDPEARMLRWDERYIQPASPAGAAGMALFRKIFSNVEPAHVHLRHPGDTLILDNWRMLHGRSAVPGHCTHRVINRTYMGSIDL